jgi:hypothetical protein
VPGEEEPPYEVLAALVAALRRELAEAVAALGQARADLAQAGERIAELLVTPGGRSTTSRPAGWLPWPVALAGGWKCI